MASQALDIINIRLATHQDIPAVTEVIKPFVEAGLLLPRTLDEFEELLPTMYVAELNGAIVGCAALEVYSQKLAEIRSLAVSHTAQKHGIGKQLVQACIELAQKKHILEVMAITSSDMFFQACGFDYTLPGEKRALFLQTRDI